MIQLHLEANGKSARVGLHGLPAAKPKIKPVQASTSGTVSGRRLVTGARKTMAPDIHFDALVAGDPEIDLALAGLPIDGETTPAYYDPTAAQPKPIGDFAQIDIVYDANGAEKDRRPHLKRRQNLNDLHPVKLGKRIKLEEALLKFSIRQTLQVVHVDGLTFEFLRDLATDLARNQEVAILGAGPKANQPLVTREGGAAYRAFLSGEVNGEGQYRLLLLLSDQELKVPEAKAEASDV
jgi:hypothetical protein